MGSGCYYHPPKELREGYVFTAVCDSVRGGGLPQCMLGYHPLPGSPGGMHPTGMQYRIPKEILPILTVD